MKSCEISLVNTHEVSKDHTCMCCFRFQCAEVWLKVGWLCFFGGRTTIWISCILYIAMYEGMKCYTHTHTHTQLLSRPLSLFHDPSTGVAALLQRGAASFLHPASPVDCLSGREQHLGIQGTLIMNVFQGELTLAMLPDPSPALSFFVPVCVVHVGAFTVGPVLIA